MRRDRRDLSPAWAKTGPLLAARLWLRDVLMLNSRSRCGAPDCAGVGRRHADARTGLCDDHDAGPEGEGVQHNRSASRRRAASARAAGTAQPVIIFHDGWYYLLVTDGSCCAGAHSSCNIRIGRSRKVTGPFVDSMGIDMLQSGGITLQEGTYEIESAPLEHGTHNGGVEGSIPSLSTNSSSTLSR
jgi:hypothetical protein